MRVFIDALGLDDETALIISQYLVYESCTHSSSVKNKQQFSFSSNGKARIGMVMDSLVRVLMEECDGL